MNGRASTERNNREVKLTVQVGNGQVPPRISYALSHDQAQTTGTASHNGNGVFQGERSESGLRKAAAMAANRPTARKLMVFGVFDSDVGIGP